MQIRPRYLILWWFLYFINKKLNKNAKVEKLTKKLGRSVRLIVIGPFPKIPLYIPKIWDANAELTETRIFIARTNWLRRTNCLLNCKPGIEPWTSLSASQRAWPLHHHCSHHKKTDLLEDAEYLLKLDVCHQVKWSPCFVYHTVTVFPFSTVHTFQPFLTRNKPQKLLRFVQW